METPNPILFCTSCQPIPAMALVTGETSLMREPELGPQKNQEQRVTVISRSLVMPARRLSSRPCAGASEHLYLSAMDLFWRDIHYNMRVLFFDYQDDEGSFRKNVVDKLRKGLEEVLVEFYPLAGRLFLVKKKKKPRNGEETDEPAGEGDEQEEEDEADGEGRFVIECSDKGVEFLEAEGDGECMRELRDSNFDMQPFFLELSGLRDFMRSDLPHLPLVSVQITKFENAGFSVGVSHSHVALDGRSLWHFMVSWGESTRGVALSQRPIHSRTLFKLNRASPELAELLPFQLQPLAPDLVEAYRKGDLVDKVFHFSEAAMQAIKEWCSAAEADMAEQHLREATAVEGLFAHTWRQVTRARRLDDDAMVSLIVLADWRRRRRGCTSAPPVPSNYVGNAITWTYTATKPKVLLAESFAATLARVVKEVDRCTSVSTLQGHIHWLELHNTSFGLGPLWFPGITMNVASSPRFPVYDVDFGWGTALIARPIRVGAIAEICLMPGHPSRGRGIDLCIKLDASSMQRLVDDPLLVPL